MKDGKMLSKDQEGRPYIHLPRRVPRVLQDLSGLGGRHPRCSIEGTTSPHGGRCGGGGSLRHLRAVVDQGSTQCRTEGKTAQIQDPLLPQFFHSMMPPYRYHDMREQVVAVVVALNPFGTFHVAYRCRLHYKPSHVMQSAWAGRTGTLDPGPTLFKTTTSVAFGFHNL